jgi:hypothetical protein
VLRAGVTPGGDEVLTVAAYNTELDGVCMDVGRALDENAGQDDEKVAVALDQAVTDVEALATPVERGEFQAELVDLAERQAVLLRQLGNEGVQGPQGEYVRALGVELGQIEADIDTLFAQQGGFKVCGRA